MTSYAKEDGFSRSHVKDFLNENIEVKNYWLTSEDDGEADDFDLNNQKINDFKETLLIPNGKDSQDPLFYVVCYAVPYT